MPVNIPVVSHRTARGAPIRDRIQVTSQTPQKTFDRIQRFNATPGTRSAAAHLLNESARSMIQIAIDIANSEFKPRSGGRRPRKGTRHYVTSFFLEEANQDSIGRMTVRFGNRHPAAGYIEYGTRPHEIPPPEFGSGTGPAFATGHLIFPFRPDATRTQPGTGRTAGTVGNWPTEFGEPGSVRMYTNEPVNHPGSPAFHIIARAKAAWLDRNRMSVGRRPRL